MWNKRYDRPEYVYGTEPNEFLKENIDYFKDGIILSLAEGEGRNAVFLAGTAAHVLAVDSSIVGLKKARQLAEQKDVSISTKVADLALFDPGENNYSGIVSIFCHLSKKVRIDLHRRCISALKPGGIFLLEGFIPSQIGRGTGGPHDPEMMHSLQELRESFSEFRELHGTERVRHFSEGIFHDGDAAVVQFITQKI